MKTIQTSDGSINKLIIANRNLRISDKEIPFRYPSDFSGLFVFKKINSSCDFIIGPKVTIVPICARKEKSVIFALVYVTELAEFGSFLCAEFAQYLVEHRRKKLIIESKRICWSNYEGYKCIPTYVSRAKYYFRSEDFILESMENFMRIREMAF